MCRFSFFTKLQKIFVNVWLNKNMDVSSLTENISCKVIMVISNCIEVVIMFYSINTKLRD